MTKWKNRERRILAREILGLLAITAVIAFVLMQVLSVCAVAIVESYLFLQDITLTDTQFVKLDDWVFHLSLIVSVGFF